MSLILKSDKVSSNNIGNSFEILGRTDFSAMMDFNRKEYFKRSSTNEKTHLELTDVISFTRTTPARLRTVEGDWVQVAPNVPRISYDSELGVGGLYIEGTITNLFVNPENPVTQDIAVKTEWQSKAVAVSVYGTGSAVVSGQFDTTYGNNLTATENNPAINAFSNVATGNLNIQIIGQVSYVQVEVIENDRVLAASSQAPLHTSGSYYKSADVTNLTASTAELFTGAKTVVFNILLNELASGVPTGYIFRDTRYILLQGSSTNSGSIHISHSTRSAEVGLRRIDITVNNYADGVVKSSNMYVPDTRNLTIAFSHDGKGGNLAYAVNGSASEFSTSPAFSDLMDAVELGGRAGNLGGLVTKIVAYNDRFTTAELEKVTRSWL